MLTRRLTLYLIVTIATPHVLRLCIQKWIQILCSYPSPLIMKSKDSTILYIHVPCNSVGDDNLSYEQNSSSTKLLSLIHTIVIKHKHTKSSTCIYKHNFMFVGWCLLVILIKVWSNILHLKSPRPLQVGVWGQEGEGHSEPCLFCFPIHVPTVPQQGDSARRRGLHRPNGDRVVGGSLKENSIHHFCGSIVCVPMYRHGEGEKCFKYCVS